MSRKLLLPVAFGHALVFSVIGCLVFIFLYLFRDYENIVHLSRDLLFIYLFSVLVMLKRHTRWMSSIMLFICTFTVFYLSRPMASFFDESFITESNKYTFYTFSDNTIAIVICFFGISLSSVIIGYLISYCKYRPLDRVIPFKTKLTPKNANLQRIIRFIICLTIPGTIFKSIFDLYLIYQYGYMILYMELPENAPSWARISWGGFSILFPMLLIFCNNKRQFYKLTIFYFAINLISFIKGTRGELILPVIYFMWFYYDNYSNKDISFRKILYIIIAIALIASVMLLTRGSKFSFDILIILEMLFLTQGVQYVFMGNYIDYSNQFAFKTHWYILYPLIAQVLWFFNPLYSKGKSALLAHETLSLDDQVMFATNQDAYYNGAGYGSSYIAELDALGGIPAIIVGSLFLGFVINWFEAKYKYNKYLILLSWFWIPSLVWKPRGNYIPSIFIPVLSIIIFWFLSKLNSMYYNRRRKIYKFYRDELY